MRLLLLGVEDQKLTVAAKSQICFQDIRSLAQRSLKGRQAVAGNIAAGNTPVGNHQNAPLPPGLCQSISHIHIHYLPKSGIRKIAQNER